MKPVNASKSPVTLSVSPRHTILRFAIAAACIAFLIGKSSPLAAQGPTGPQLPPKPPNVIRIPATPMPDTPPIPSDEIIRRFATQEDEFARARAGYTYVKIVRVEEIGPDGKPAGQAEVVSTPVVAADGTRSQKASGGQDSTLRVLSLERDALEALAKIPEFPLVTEQLSKYEIAYEGTQPLDELTTYVFRVTPKQLERSRAYFSGLVWVDNRDLAIVKTYGKWITETGDVSPPELPFTIYETYRQPVSNKYWLPAYSRSDSSASTKSGSVQVRLIIRWNDYQLISAAKPSVPPEPASASEPAANPSR